MNKTTIIFVLINAFYSMQLFSQNPCGFNIKYQYEKDKIYDESSSEFFKKQQLMNNNIREVFMGKGFNNYFEILINDSLYLKDTLKTDYSIDLVNAKIQYNPANSLRNHLKIICTPQNLYIEIPLSVEFLYTIVDIIDDNKIVITFTNNPLKRA